MSSVVARTNEPAARCIDMDSLTKRCLGRVDLAYRVLKKFHSSVGNDLALLEQAIAAQNLSEVARVAHRVRGASLTVSACNLAEYSHRLECRALSQGPSAEQRINEKLDSLDVLWWELRSEFENVSELTIATTEGVSGNE